MMFASHIKIGSPPQGLPPRPLSMATEHPGETLSVSGSRPPDPRAPFGARFRRTLTRGLYINY